MKLIRLHLPVDNGGGFLTLQANQATTASSLVSMAVQKIRQKRRSLSGETPAGDAYTLQHTVSGVYLPPDELVCAVAVDGNSSGQPVNLRLVRTPAQLLPQMQSKQLVKVHLPEEEGGGFLTVAAELGMSIEQLQDLTLATMKKKRKSTISARKSQDYNLEMKPTSPLVVESASLEEIHQQAAGSSSSHVALRKDSLLRESVSQGYTAQPLQLYLTHKAPAAAKEEASATGDVEAATVRIARVFVPEAHGGGFLTMPLTRHTTVGQLTKESLDKMKKKRPNLNQNVSEHNFTLEHERVILSADAKVLAGVPPGQGVVELYLLLSAGEETRYLYDGFTAPAYWRTVDESRTNHQRSSSSGAQGSGEEKTEIYNWTSLFFCISEHMLAAWPTKAEWEAREPPVATFRLYAVSAVFCHENSCRVIIQLRHAASEEGASLSCAVNPASTVHLCVGSPKQSRAWLEKFRSSGVHCVTGVCGLHPDEDEDAELFFEDGDELGYNCWKSNMCNRFHNLSSVDGEEEDKSQDEVPAAEEEEGEDDLEIVSVSGAKVIELFHVSSAQMRALAASLPAALRVVHIRNNVPQGPKLEARVNALCEVLLAVPGSNINQLDIAGLAITENLANALTMLIKANGSLSVLGLHLYDMGLLGAEPATPALSPDQTDELTNQLMTSLSSNNKLLSLDASDTNLGEAVGVTLASILRTHRTLKDLCLANCSLAQRITAAATANALEPNLIGIHLGEALVSNTRLTSLDLSSNGLGDGNSRAIVKALQHNTTLTRLLLNDNSITSAADIAKAVRNSSTLKELCLANNFFSSGVDQLCKVLRNHDSLRLLDLSSCDLGAAGARKVAKMLKANSGLQSIGLASNKLGLSGVVAILDSVVSHPRLYYLDVSDNDTGPGVMKPVSQLLERNPNVTTLHVGSNGLSSEDCMAIEDLSNSNQGKKDGVSISPRLLHFPILTLNANVRVMKAFVIKNVRKHYVAFSVLTNAPETTAMSPFVGYLAPASSVLVHVLVMGHFCSADAASHLLVCRIATVDPVTADARPEDFWRRQQVARSYRSTYLRCIGVPSGENAD